MHAVEILIYVFLGIGTLFNLLGSFGILRFPDVYTRLHAGTKCTTFGTIFITFAVITDGIYLWTSDAASGSILTIHAVIALVALLLTNPAGAHAIARAAYRSGVKPFGAVVDDLATNEELVMAGEDIRGADAVAVKKEVSGE